MTPGEINMEENRGVQQFNNIECFIKKPNTTEQLLKYNKAELVCNQVLSILNDIKRERLTAPVKCLQKWRSLQVTKLDSLFFSLYSNASFFQGFKVFHVI